MTGTSARETSRPAKRPRPSATNHPSNIAPPVLFRLPSISQPGCEDDRFGSSAAISHGALAMSASAASSATSAQAPPFAATSGPATAATESALALANKKAAGQRLFNSIIIALLLVALAIISVFAFRGGQSGAKPALADRENQPKEHLESLSDIRVPTIAVPQANLPRNQPSPAAQPSEASKPSAGFPGAGQLSLEKPELSTGASPGLTMDAADLAKKPSPAAAQVQLGTPVPMANNAALGVAASPSPSAQGGTSSLPLTTPRYETVSTPSTSGAASSSSSSPTNGASPTLYDGASKAAGQKPSVNAETISAGSNDSEMSLIPSAYSSASGKTPAAEAVAGKNAAAPASSSLGVTVGAGMSEPEFPTAQATANPDLDVAAISSKFLEYSRQKSAAPASMGTEVVNPYAQAAPPAGYATPATTVSTGGYASAASQQPPATQNPATAGAPYGTTGTTLTPYVRNAPTGAAPSGLGTPTAAAPGPSAATVYPSLSSGSGYQQQPAPAGSTGYNTGYNAQAAGGFAIPARGGSVNPAQMTAGATAPASSPTAAYGYPAGPNPGYAPAMGSPTASAGGSAAYRPSAVTSSSPYPGGQAPQGMIGQSGFATAPSGDVVGRPPIPVTGTMGYGTSPTR